MDKPYIIDGTNVIFWASAPGRERDRDQTYLSILLVLLTEIKRKNQSFRCFFDPGTLFRATKQEKTILNQLLNNYTHKFEVIKSGQADDFIIQTADYYGSRIISNDQFRDLGGISDEILIKGHVADMPDKETRKNCYFLMVPDLKIMRPIELQGKDQHYFAELTKLLKRN